MTTEPNDRPTPLEPSESSRYESAEKAARYNESLGPWATAQAVMDACHVTKETLRTWRHTNVVLGVLFNDGNYYYPAQQFHAGEPAPGLPAVLAALTPGFIAEASRVAWFAGAAYVGGEATRWDLLHEGKTELLISWAEEEVARITAR